MQSIDDALKRINLHEGLDRFLSMSERLKKAADRLKGGDDQSRTPAEYTLRAEQQTVFEDVAYFFHELAESEGDQSLPFGRIILPPRTGKTIVAGFVIRFAQLHSLFVVPSAVLVGQTATRIREMMPDVAVGEYYGEIKNLVENGVNVTTYSSLQRAWRDNGKLPEQIASAALIFVDEAHHAMTKSRHEILQQGFDELAARIALTATPDYNSQKTLNNFYPELIHEITLLEAIEMQLLAPARFWVAEVDQDASEVKLVAGDYDNETLGELMSTAPFLEAAAMFRYSEANRYRPALMTCKTRRQAYELLRYFTAFRPQGAAEPQIILHETPKKDREKILRRYDIGYYDTLICVGVLIEGWDSPRCKLLIDLSPSASRVRATQKFCRVMTKNGTDEAHIYCIVPKDLCARPLYPVDILGFSADDYISGDLLEPKKLICPQQSNKQTENPEEMTKISNVRLVHRIAAAMKVEKPRLRKDSIEQVHDVMSSHASYNPTKLWGFFRFMRLQFNHRLFSGSGRQLLNYLGIPRTSEVYQLFLEQVLDIRLPDGAHRAYYQALKSSLKTRSTTSEYDRLQAFFASGTAKSRAEAERAQTGWLALGGSVEAIPDPEAICAIQEEIRLSLSFAEQLTPFRRKVLYYKLGLCGHPIKSAVEIAKIYNLSKAYIGTIYHQSAMEILAEHINSRERAKRAHKQAVALRQKTEAMRYFKLEQIYVDRANGDYAVLHPKTMKPVGFYSQKHKKIVYGQ
ncbi:MAG: DEAD/DEAH box helicase [Patescibacteria group bacterium]